MTRIQCIGLRVRFLLRYLPISLLRSPLALRVRRALSSAPFISASDESQHPFAVADNVHLPSGAVISMKMASRRPRTARGFFSLFKA